MTATRHPPPRILTGTDPQRSKQALTPGEADVDLGPLCFGFASIYLTLAMLMAAPVYPTEPWMSTVVLVFPIGALLLAPRSHMRRVVFDGPLFLLIGWIMLSVLWSFHQEFGLFSIRRDVPLWISASLMASLLPKEEVFKAVKRAIAIAIVITIVGLLLDPATRATASESIYLNDIPGWHGYFIHKNVLAPYLVFALVLLLNFEGDRIKRAVALGVIAVLLVGSDSATGMSAAVIVGALFVWFRFFFRNPGRRQSSAYVVASGAVALIGIMGAGASLSVLTNAAGKDLTFSGRTFIWRAVLNAIEDRPILGYGIGGVFWDPGSEVTRSIWRDTGFHIPHSHSGALDVWLNYGIVGLVLFIVFFTTSVAKGVRLLRTSPRLAEWLLTLLAVQLLMGLSENVFVGSWLVYMGIARAVAQRELNQISRSKSVEHGVATEHLDTDPRPKVSSGEPRLD